MLIMATHVTPVPELKGLSDWCAALMVLGSELAASTWEYLAVEPSKRRVERKGKERKEEERRGEWRPLTAGSLVCVIQAVGVPVTLEALGNAVAAATLEVARVARPEL